MKDLYTTWTTEKKNTVAVQDVAIYRGIPEFLLQFGVAPGPNKSSEYSKPFILMVCELLLFLNVTNINHQLYEFKWFPQPYQLWSGTMLHTHTRARGRLYQ